MILKFEMSYGNQVCPKIEAAEYLICVHFENMKKAVPVRPEIGNKHNMKIQYVL